MNNVLDFGGGDGLLCRLLRDYGTNCYVADKYAAPSYALAFTRPDFQVPDLLLAFEVFEHFQNPLVELQSLFSIKPQALLASTCLYAGQGADWWYLTPETGQHLFFYSREALSRIALTYGYTLVIQGEYILFVKADQLEGLRRLAVRILLCRPILRLIGALLRLLPTRGVTLDFNFLRSKTK